MLRLGRIGPDLGPQRRRRWLTETVGEFCFDCFGVLRLDFFSFFILAAECKRVYGVSHSVIGYMICYFTERDEPPG